MKKNLTLSYEIPLLILENIKLLHAILETGKKSLTTSYVSQKYLFLQGDKLPPRSDSSNGLWRALSVVPLSGAETIQAQHQDHHTRGGIHGLFFILIPFCHWWRWKWEWWAEFIVRNEHAPDRDTSIWLVEHAFLFVWAWITMKNPSLYKSNFFYFGGSPSYFLLHPSYFQ